MLAQDFEYSMCRFPTISTTTTQLIEDLSLTGCSGGIVFGISQVGILYSPFARLYFVNPNTQQENLDFHEEAVNVLNMDINGGHVNTLGRYHYHLAPLSYIVNDLKIDGTSHSPILGYAADGFPIYYKYLNSSPMDANSSITTFESSYSLKTGTRSGDGITAPNGAYDGNYYEDYEYVLSMSELDECGGRFGVTPDYPQGTYYYVLTDNWPYIPRCLNGTNVDNSFGIGSNCNASTSDQDCSPAVITSAADLAHSLSISSYPNPTSAVVNIQIDESLKEKITSQILYHINGTIVFESQEFAHSITVSSLKRGTYFLQININGEQVTKKITLN